jgi:hypothetical protein
LHWLAPRGEVPRLSVQAVVGERHFGSWSVRFSLDVN